MKSVRIILLCAVVSAVVSAAVSAMLVFAVNETLVRKAVALNKTVRMLEVKWRYNELVDEQIMELMCDRHNMRVDPFWRTKMEIRAKQIMKFQDGENVDDILKDENETEEPSYWYNHNANGGMP